MPLGPWEAQLINIWITLRYIGATLGRFIGNLISTVASSVSQFPVHIEPAVFAMVGHRVGTLWEGRAIKEWQGSWRSFKNKKIYIGGSLHNFWNILSILKTLRVHLCWREAQSFLRHGPGAISMLSGFCRMTVSLVVIMFELTGLIKIVRNGVTVPLE